MKLLASLLFVLAGLNGFGQKQPAVKLPELNQKIIDYVNQNIGKKVGRGECWDLVQIPLTENASITKKTRFYPATSSSLKM